VPPLAVTVAEPVLSPLQATFVLSVIVAVSTGGSVIVTVAVAVQLLSSVIVTA
jgi:hypothetical protein